MEEAYLYHQIAESIRQDILEGRLKPGDRLPSVRQMMKLWDCTPGTAQRAYQELARQGLVVSRPGKGTHVAGAGLPVQSQAPLRMAALVNRSEAFLLEMLTAGYNILEIQQSLVLALDRWRVLKTHPAAPPADTIHFSGSHDLAVAWLADHFDHIHPYSRLEVTFSGSLGGLMALAEGKAHLAGCHLWDEESDSYNLPFVRRLLPGRPAVLITLVHRCLGLILPPGNPQNISGLGDLPRPGVRFVNRQTGSGTRVWLDANLARLKIDVAQIQGYTDERQTHSDVARAIAEGEAAAGLGLKQSAMAYSLDFILLARERYDLVFMAENADRPVFKALREWLASAEAKAAFSALGGYEVEDTGRVQQV